MACCREAPSKKFNRLIRPSRERRALQERCKYRSPFLKRCRVIEAGVITGHPLLRDAALQAARQWVFKPTELSGVPVKVQGVLTFNFTLQ